MPGLAPCPTTSDRHNGRMQQQIGSAAQASGACSQAQQNTQLSRRVPTASGREIGSALTAAIWPLTLRLEMASGTADPEDISAFGGQCLDKRATVCVVRVKKQATQSGPGTTALMERSWVVSNSDIGKDWGDSDHSQLNAIKLSPVSTLAGQACAAPD